MLQFAFSTTFKSKTIIEVRGLARMAKGVYIPFFCTSDYGEQIMEYILKPLQFLVPFYYFVLAIIKVKQINMYNNVFTLLSMLQKTPNHFPPTDGELCV